LNVLTISDTISVNGLGNVSSRLALGFTNYGHSSTMISLYNEASMTDEFLCCVNVVSLHINRKDCRRKVLKIISNKISGLIQSNGKKFDLILVHGQSTTKILKNYKHTAIYFYVHNTLSLDLTNNYSFLKGAIKKIKARILYKNLNLICVSEGVKHDVLKVMNIQPKSIQVIYNGLDKELILAKSKMNNINKNENYIINISRFVPEKRHDILIKAFIKSEIDCKLILVGEGFEKQKYENIIKDLGLQDQIIFMGHLENPYPVLSGARYLVHTADFEGFGLVLLEALILDIPVIARNCPSGPNEILTGALQDSLIAMDDFDGLVQCMIKQSSEKKEDMSAYTKKFLLENIVPEYEKLI